MDKTLHKLVIHSKYVIMLSNLTAHPGKPGTLTSGCDLETDPNLVVMKIFKLIRSMKDINTCISLTALIFNGNITLQLR